MTSDMNPLNQMEYEPWIFAVIGSLLIGLSGVFPILIIPIDDLEHMNAKKGELRIYKIWVHQTWQLYLLLINFHET